MQNAVIFVGPTSVQFELPAANREVMPGVLWGSVDAFPTPAYWAYQVLARRLVGTPIRYRLGDTLTEEIAACVLGGHGIPAGIGLAAFRQLKSAGVFTSTPTEDEVLSLLSVPIEIDGRIIHYRFAKQKSRYLSTILARLAIDAPPTDTGKSLREWLLNLPGIGYKTASWIARNSLDADDVAILDIHVLRAGHLAGFFDGNLTVGKHYLQLEKQFLDFSEAIGVRSAELDAVIWHEMMTSVKTVRKISSAFSPRNSITISRRSTNKCRTDSHQSRLFD